MAPISSRRRWTIAGIFLGSSLISWLGAMASARVVESMLALPEDAELASLEVQEAPPPGEAGVTKEATGDEPAIARSGPPRLNRSNYLDPIIERNIFDASASGAGPDDGPSEGDRRSDLKVELLATMVASPAEYSSALIAEEGGSGAQGYGVGDTLLGEATIVRIEQKKVHIRRSDGQVEFITMDGGDAVAARPAGGERGAAEPEEAGGVTKEGENKYVVDKELIDKIMENPEQLYSQVRAVPHKGPDGEIDGYRLSGIRRNSFFQKLGIKNGDIVHSVNGRPLTSMSSAMEAYNSLASDRNFSFDVTRRNNRQNFDYEVR